MRKITAILTLIVIAIVLTLTVYFTAKPRPVVVQGTADATEVKISSRVPGRVDQIYVKEGDSVKSGELLITLDAPDLRAKAVQAAAVRRAAASQQEKAETGARPEEIDAAFNLWQKAIVAERIAKQTNTRITQLYSDGVVSTQQRDEAQARYDAAKKDTLAAEAQYSIAQKGARQEDKDAASAAAQQASGALMEVESYLEDTALTAPIDGEVATVVLSRGELAGSGFPLITITDLSDIYFVFNIREDLMPHFKMGEHFKVKIPAVGQGDYEVKITFIAPRGSFATWSSTKTTGDFDLRTFEVRMRPVTPIADLRPGMSAIIHF
ncbi:efflux RND transporter periplasmic adaptor subunit [Desulfovibrio sp. OttesenSCG-928-F07]|nr:efflux RND transporter periplasmic adaptor subunit [Desulfovibrio sp. OttesenSCG-928-F07]